MTEFDPRHYPEKEQPTPPAGMLRSIGCAATRDYADLRTVRNRLPTLYRAVEEEVADSPQPLHPDIAMTVYHVRKALAGHHITPPENIPFSDKLTQSIRMAQFTNHLSSEEQAFFDYDTMKDMKERFVSSAEQQMHPLGFGQQLDIALELFDGNITESLTSLWLTSRQYARWFDSVSIRGLPEFSAEETIKEMKEWRSSILACKNADAKNFQDTAGDSYYAWTHALAQVMYGSGSGLPDRIGKLIFSHGTTIMHVGVHSLIKQSVPSNHRAAAAYGNRIGETILESIREQ